eukprot:1177726-Prorocentrum_minimum.AAC.1
MSPASARSFLSPYPSWPLSFLPKHLTREVSNNAHTGAQVQGGQVTAHGKRIAAGHVADLAISVLTPAPGCAVTQQRARVCGRAAQEDLRRVASGPKVQRGKRVAHRARIRAPVCCIAVSELALVVLSPALGGLVVQQCARHFVPREDAGGGAACAQVHLPQVGAHLARLVSHRSPRSGSFTPEPELAVAVLTPALDRAAAQQRARVFIPGGQIQGRDRDAQVHVGQVGAHLVRGRSVLHIVARPGESLRPPALDTGRAKLAHKQRAASRVTCARTARRPPPGHWRVTGARVCALAALRGGGGPRASRARTRKAKKSKLKQTKAKALGRTKRHRRASSGPPPRLRDWEASSSPCGSNARASGIGDVSAALTDPLCRGRAGGGRGDPGRTCRHGDEGTQGVPACTEMISPGAGVVVGAVVGVIPVTPVSPTKASFSTIWLLRFI